MMPCSIFIWIRDLYSCICISVMTSTKTFKWKVIMLNVFIFSSFTWKIFPRSFFLRFPLFPFQVDSHQRCSTEKVVLKEFATFTGKDLRRSNVLIKLKVFRPATLLQRDSNTGIFLWILRNFTEHLFRRTSATRSFCRQFYNISCIVFWFYV